jgi:hypothetical protein
MIKFKSRELKLLVDAGQFVDETSRDFIRGALGLKKKKVEATRHTILSGPPGVGKTYGTQDECNKGKVKYIKIDPGTSDINLTIKLACAVHSLKKDEELIVLLDDADDVVFGSYETLNKWKIAMGDINYDIGLVPYYAHNVSMTNTIAKLEEVGKQDLADALKSFQDPGSIGVNIPMDRVRFVILCNLDLEDPKAFGRNKVKSAIPAIMDRFNYSRINLNWEYQWGWLAYVLSNSQPFEEHPLTDEQKKELLEWMYSNWKNLRSTSYRMVRKLAEAVINEPDSYQDTWATHLKGH